ncbi:hypothetical protein MTO96_016050 [Rhipicephalus appendiculatus]
MWHLQRTADVSVNARGFSGVSSPQWDMLTHTVILIKNVVFSPIVYLMLNSECKDEKERRLFEALTLGVTIADRLFTWMYNLVWSERDQGNIAFREWLHCHQQPAGRKALAFHDNHVSVALRARSGAHGPTQLVAPHHRSLEHVDGAAGADILYLFFYMRHLCGRIADTKVLNTISLRMNALPGFNTAFQCPPVATGSHDLCVRCNSDQEGGTQ